MDKLKKFFVNGILMTAVALLARYISVQFNVYISDKIGTVAMGIFTLISSVYGFALTLATSGISLASTKLVSEAIGVGEQTKNFDTRKTVSAIMKKSLLFSFFISSSVAIGLFLLAPFIGENILHEAQTISSLKILAFSLPPIALSSSLYGYFVAVRKAYKNAVTQILSQGMRIYFCVMLLSGSMADDLESACIAIVLGGTLSEILSFGFQALLFLFERSHDNQRNSKNGICEKSFASKLIKITVPVALSAYMRSALVTVEHLLIPWGLQRSGESREKSLSAYGTVHSLVFPLVLFPSAISSSFAGLLVPEISESDALGDKARIDRIISRVFKTVLIYSVGISGIMISLSGEIGEILFFGTDSAKYIALIAPLIPIMYIDTSVDSILKGLGHQFYSMIVNIVDALLSVILVAILLPKFGIAGYIMTVYFTETVNATLSITKLLISTKTKINIFDIIIKPIVCIIFATKLSKIISSSLGILAANGFELFIYILLLSLFYIFLLFFCKALNAKKIIRSVKNFFKG